MKDDNLTIAFVGCGNMGGAVLLGLLDALYPSAAAEDDDTTTPTSTKITSFIACTKSEAGASRLRRDLGRHASRVDVLAAQNLVAVARADVIVLGCKPYMADEILRARGMRNALEGKFIISLIGGMTANDVRCIVLGNSDYRTPHVAKVVPNVAARYRESVTILEAATPQFALPAQEAALLEWIFRQVGTTKVLPENQVNNGEMLITNTLATLSVALEGLLDGAVVGGLRRADAMDLAVQGVRGLSAMLENNIHPAVMRESISSPGGSTIQSLMTVEKAASRAVFAQAQIDGTNHLNPRTISSSWSD